jgi:predicted house-cleaning noncanonical NTP pyrophosphatase (MazG superfamily)
MKSPKMRKFVGNKMWRDKAYDRKELAQSIIHYRMLDDQEYEQQLRSKLSEEVEEVVHAASTPKLVEEIADLYEVIDALCAVRGITRDEIMKAKEAKFAQLGGYYSKKFVMFVEHQEGSWGEKYCLADPLKYPEIT